MLTIAGGIFLGLLAWGAFVSWGRRDLEREAAAVALRRAQLENVTWKDLASAKRENRGIDFKPPGA